MQARYFYTPFGAGEDERGKHVFPAAEEVGLKAVGARNATVLKGEHGVLNRLKSGKLTIDQLSGQEIMIHFWEGGSRLNRFVAYVKHGSWEAAVKANPELFKE